MTPEESLKLPGSHRVWTTMGVVRHFALVRRFKWRRHRQRVADEPALDTAEKRADLLKQIAAGITTQPGIRK
jgi:hypothetical protein